MDDQQCLLWHALGFALSCGVRWRIGSAGCGHPVKCTWTHWQTPVRVQLHRIPAQECCHAGPVTERGEGPVGLLPIKQNGFVS
eukprot:1161590-Pelagomonas_calceolata.AAC.2